MGLHHRFAHRQADAHIALAVTLLALVSAAVKKAVQLLRRNTRAVILYYNTGRSVRLFQ